MEVWVGSPEPPSSSLCRCFLFRSVLLAARLEQAIRWLVWSILCICLCPNVNQPLQVKLLSRWSLLLTIYFSLNANLEKKLTGTSSFSSLVYLQEISTIDLNVYTY